MVGPFDRLMAGATESPDMHAQVTSAMMKFIQLIHASAEDEMNFVHLEQSQEHDAASYTKHPRLTPSLFVARLLADMPVTACTAWEALASHAEISFDIA